MDASIRKSEMPPIGKGGSRPTFDPKPVAEGSGNDAEGIDDDDDDQSSGVWEWITPGNRSPRKMLVPPIWVGVILFLCYFFYRFNGIRLRLEFGGMDRA